MFDYIFNRKNSVPRPSLYCVWIRAHQGENAPLIRVWIDPSMSMFDSQAKVHEPGLAADRRHLRSPLMAPPSASGAKPTSKCARMAQYG